MGWSWNDQHEKPPAPRLVSDDKRVRLYDNHGRILVRDNTVGFKPPQAAPSDPPPKSDRQRVQQQGQKTRS